jgi:hypothetical protein
MNQQNPQFEANEQEKVFIEERVAQLLPQLEALTFYRPRDRERGKGTKVGWKTLAAQEAALLQCTYPDERPEHQKTYSTCVRQVVRLDAALKEAAKTNLKSPKNYRSVLTIIKHFSEALCFQFEVYQYPCDRNFGQYLAQFELDLTPYLTQAYQLLQAVVSGATLQDIEWRDVSCALALVTGRRMAEIHLSAQFQSLDEYCVIFTGQLKGKSRKIEGDWVQDYPFAIPTLIRADWVCKGLVWLAEQGKRCSPDEDPSRVNRRWSKVLSQRVKEKWAVMGEYTTYRKLRIVYFQAALANNPEKAIQVMDYARDILGDNDEATVQNYLCYTIKPDTLTRI